MRRIAPNGGRCGMGSPTLSGGGVPGATPEKFLKNKDYL